MFRFRAFVASLLFTLSAAAQTAEAPRSIAFTNGLVLGSVGRSGRNAFHTDAIEQAIVTDRWRPPAAGLEVAAPGGTNRAWQLAASDRDGNFTGPELRGGYLYATYVSDRPDILLLDAAGHNLVYVNGEPRPGDPYSNGILLLPVTIHSGTNEFLFSVGRGRLNARLTQPRLEVFLHHRDHTLPDIVRDETDPLWGAIVVINTTRTAMTNLALAVRAEGTRDLETPLPSIPPMSVRKVPFQLPQPDPLPATNVCDFSLKLIDLDHTSAPLDTQKLSLRIRQPTDHYKHTFRSEIDGSIQYYAVAPPNPLPEPGDALALFLSTHGASVEAMGQADAYASKSWGYLIAPTNRRPYGFDWEDWGRGDALEVLNLAQAKFKTDPAQTYLTGHSMGGHGAWQLGVTFPNRFAAVAPSAGWISFWSYAGASRSTNPAPVENLIQRANTPGDTLALSSNYLQQAIYILHGDADDNVPVSEARTMKEKLGAFHHDFLYHEQPGAGHWWGNACVDWPPIFNLFAHHKIPADSTVTSIHFSTANPGISSSDHWVTIETQEHCLARSTVDLSYEPGPRRVSGDTENVAHLSLALTRIAPPGPASIELDGQKISLDAVPSPAVRLAKLDGVWKLAPPADPQAKGPRRYGPFKEAFNHRMLFVYGTKGTEAENRWAYARARYDAEAWWYRGNGAVDLVPDAQFDPAADPHRGVVLYGNAENNAAWPALLGASPVQVTRSAVKIGEREFSGADLACLFLRPRPNSTTACVAAVSGTGLPGLRLTERVPYLLAGVGLPDVTVFGVESLAEGVKGARAAGYFGNDWSVDHGEFEYASPANP